MKQSRLTRLAMLEASGRSPVSEVQIQVQYVDALTRVVEAGPQYTYAVPVHQLRRAWWQQGGGNEES
jgi:hypothetical protein